MKRHTASAALAVTVLVAGTLTASTAAASPPGPEGNTPAPVAAPVVGTLDGPLRAAADGVRYGSARDATLRVYELRYPAGSFSGWHSHPGVVIAVVRSGSVERQTGCVVETFEAGEAFTEVGDHYVRNPGPTEAILEITQVYPASFTANRFEAAAPTCPSR